ncbi:velvet factor domain-containing protein [Purpureocillium lavendulum]|uniref:Velvet factor domain-containing protein n=1 Tax=Purpureocillium lavendulum TaxID=1247861 RepID=A0AB34FXA4_9HYPO|nr:velvet factor domain-containing protein [Purpureocillium lavendulum]
MPAKVTYMSADIDAHLHLSHTQAQHQLDYTITAATTTAKTTSSSSSNMPEFKIGVQPPKKVQAGTYLYPPVIAKQSVRLPEGDVDYFATAVLLDRRGTVMDGYLDGTKAASRYEVASSKSSSASFVFPFADLSIAHTGTFTIRIDVYQFVPGDYAGAVLVEQLSTRAITVVAGEAAAESPCEFLYGGGERASDLVVSCTCADVVDSIRRAVVDSQGPRCGAAAACMTGRRKGGAWSCRVDLFFLPR